MANQSFQLTWLFQDKYLFRNGISRFAEASSLHLLKCKRILSQCCGDPPWSSFLCQRPWRPLILWLESFRVCLLQHPVSLRPALLSYKSEQNFTHLNPSSASKVAEFPLYWQNQQQKSTSISSWSDPVDLLRGFNTSMDQTIAKSKEKAIICDWIYPPQDIIKLPLPLPKNVSFYPHIIPIGDTWALFFCHSLNDAIRAASKGAISLTANTVYLDRHHRLMNAIDTNFFHDFEDGLPSGVFLLIRGPQRLLRQLLSNVDAWLRSMSKL